MEQKQILQQMIDYNKTSFENAYEAIILIQDQAEKAASMAMDQASWLPKEGKSVLNEWTNSCKKGRTEFKKIVDDNFKKVEDMMKSA